MSNLKTAKKILSQLDSEQRKFVETKKMKATHTVREWLEFFRQLVILDSAGDKARKTQKGLWITFLIFAIVFLFFAFAVPLLFAVVAVFTGLFIFSLTNYNKLKKIDLGNHLRQFVVPVLALLREDMRKKEKITLQLDMSNPVQKAYLTENVPPKNRRYPRVNTFFYTLPWLDALITLADGTKIDCHLEDIVRRREVTKLSASGKVKHKTKMKVKHVFQMQAAFPKEKYQLASQGAPKLPYTEKTKTHNFKLKGKAVSMKVEQSPDVNYFLDMIASAYRSVKPL